MPPRSHPVKLTLTCGREFDNLVYRRGAYLGRSRVSMSSMKFRILFLAFWLALSSPALSADPIVVPADAPRMALVLANSKYKLLSPLANPANDAATMAGVLRKLHFNVTVSLDLDRLAMWRAVEEFAAKIKARGADTVGLVFYAGHGMEDDGENYILPVEADIRSKSEARVQGLSVRTMTEQLGKAGNHINILVLDACRNNPFAGRSFRGAEVRGLTAMGAVFGVFIASSTAAGDVALDGPSGQNSPYTRALAEAVVAPGEKLEDVFKSVRRRVRNTTSQKQIPWEASSLEVDFYFVPPERQLTAAQQMLEAARQMRNEALVEMIIEKYSGTPTATEAQGLLKELRRDAAAASKALQEQAAKNKEAQELAAKTKNAQELAARTKEAQELAARTKEAQDLAAQNYNKRVEDMTKTLMQRAEESDNAEAFDLVAMLFPGTSYATQSQAKAGALRARQAAAQEQPQLEGNDLVLAIQTELRRIGCLQKQLDGRFDVDTIQGLRTFSTQSDARFYWHRPTMAALRALKREVGATKCTAARAVAATKCLNVNREAICE